MHDAESHDWTNPKKYQEGERFSISIQVLSFHLQSK